LAKSTFVARFLRSLPAMHLDYSELKANSRRADELTRTSDYLITSDRSGVRHFDYGA
jgi:hypothetical protein